MDKKLAITLLIKQKDEIENLRPLTYSDATFKKWNRNTLVAIQNIFKNDESHINDFKHIIFTYIPGVNLDTEGDAIFQHGLDDAKFILQSFIDEIETYWSIETHGSNEGTLKNLSEYFISPQRIEELVQIKSIDFDLSKLIRLCNEINIAYQHDCLYPCAFITRAILDHVPPIFGCKNYTEMINNFPFQKSIKKNLENLDKSLRNIADTHLHAQISKKEILPTEQQINFSNDLDVLLGEIIRIINKRKKL